jgi:ribosomal protein L16/L10AE
MKSCKVGYISYQAIEVVCCVISKEFRRNGQIWVKVFANIPITSKPTKTRMEKEKEILQAGLLMW